MCISGDVHVLVPTNVKSKVISLKIFFIFTVKINTTHVAINIGSANAPPTPHKIYALHCKEHTPIYMLIMISDANIMLTICKSLVYKVPKSNKSYDSSRVAAV